MTQKLVHHCTVALQLSYVMHCHITLYYTPVIMCFTITRFSLSSMHLPCIITVGFVLLCVLCVPVYESVMLSLDCGLSIEVSLFIIYLLHVYGLCTR